MRSAIKNFSRGIDAAARLLLPPKIFAVFWRSPSKLRGPGGFGCPVICAYGAVARQSFDAGDSGITRLFG
jgi:hypothetical protein